jgi:hypothetical protein
LDRAARDLEPTAGLQHPDPGVGGEQGEQSAVEIVHLGSLSVQTA